MTVTQSPLFKLLCMTILFITLNGCSLFGKDDERSKTKGYTESQLYERIQGLLDDDLYGLAVENLQLLESRFPFGVYAQQAQLEIIYAYYRSGDEGAAVASAERFIRLHPRHPDVDYAYYMKGLANYSLKPGFFSRFIDIDRAARDVGPARRSFSEFQEFLQFFPESQYAADARVRMIHIKQTLARHELLVANYYIERQAYLAAINRAKQVLETYQKTSALPDALATLAYCYSRLELHEQSQEYVELLKLNAPNHFALDADGSFVYDERFDPNKKSSINRLSYGLLDAPKAPQFVSD